MEDISSALAEFSGYRGFQVTGDAVTPRFMVVSDCETPALAGPVWRRGAKALLAALCLCLGLQACTVPTVEEANLAALTLLSSRKDQAKPDWGSRRIGKETAREYAENRTAALVAGEVSMTFSDVHVNLADGTATGRVRIEGEGEAEWGAGTASAVTEDGYFLTAAHCVKTGPVYIIGGNELGPEAFRARLVWVSPSKDPIHDSDEPDLALIHVPLHPSRNFALAQPEEISPGTRVVTAGYGGLQLNQAYGKVLRLGPWKTSETSGARWMELDHSAPIIQGDSGGPAVDDQGRLLGINSAVGFRVVRILGQENLRGYRCLTVCPDPEWIRALIEKDRAKRR